MPDTQRVVIGVLKDNHGRILVAKRPLEAHLGGLWEFPGGKIEAGEPVFAALQREIAEELGITVLQARPLIRLRHAYPDKSLELDVWFVETWTGAPVSNEGQPIDWVAPDNLLSIEMPAANRSMIDAIRLPSLYLITDEPTDTDQFFATLDAVLSAGVAMIQLRAKKMDESEFIALARETTKRCHAVGTRLLINNRLDLVDKIDADGVQLTSDQMLDIDQRPLSMDKWLGVSCHNADELRQAEIIGANFALLSPVQATPTHPQARPLGWAAWGAMVADCSLPVYALGGVQVADYKGVYQMGGQGLAVLGGIWRSPDPAAAARAFRSDSS